MLDINVLLALAWQFHVHHHICQAWFARVRRAGFRTCPITELGFVRLSSNPAFTGKAVTPEQALQVLHDITQLPEHEFWPDGLSGRQALERVTLLGHRQITDAYLIALARENKGVFATLDRGTRALAPEPDLVELIAASWN